MTSEQSYVGKGNYAIPTSPPVDNDLPTAFLGHSQPRTPFSYLDEQVSSSQAILDLTSEWADQSSIIPLLADIIEQWTTTPHADITSHLGQRNLRRLLGLISFLTELREAAKEYRPSLEESGSKAAPVPKPNEEGVPAGSINPRVFDVQTQLLDLTDNFVKIGYAGGPLEAINNLLVHCLSTPPQTLSGQADKDNMHCALLLTDLLSELYQVQGSTVVNGREGQNHA